MKPNYLITSMLACATIVAMSCSAPRLAQQNTNDDVYNSVAKAREYKQQVPVRASEYNAQDEYYGTSDPYYDMDYSSRINRFYNYRPWNNYYDPYFDNGWYGNYGLSLGLGFGYNPFYGSLWNYPYHSWGNYYSPFWRYNNYYGGGYYGGGFWGGGYWGGGYYTGRTTNVEDYRARPARGSRDGYTGTRGYGNNDYLSPRSSARGQGNANTRPGEIMSEGRPSRINNGNSPSSTESSRPARNEGSRPARSERPDRTETARPTRERESYTPPSYSPPPSRGNEGGSGGRGYGGSNSGGGAGGTGRPSRGGGR